MSFIKRYYWLILFVIGLVFIAGFVLTCLQKYHESREKYRKEHPEEFWEDGHSIKIFKNNEVIVTTPCGACVSTTTDYTGTVMTVHYSMVCRFMQEDEVTTIPLESGAIYSVKKNKCKIKPNSR
jgi:hypothetical protein